MKKYFSFVLSHKNFELDDIHIDFYGSLYQARKAYNSLSYALVSSPYSRFSLIDDNFSVIMSTELRGSYVR